MLAIQTVVDSVTPAGVGAWPDEGAVIALTADGLGTATAGEAAGEAAATATGEAAGDARGEAAGDAAADGDGTASDGETDGAVLAAGFVGAATGVGAGAWAVPLQAVSAPNMTGAISARNRCTSGWFAR